jgi:hypothetical protein
MKASTTQFFSDNEKSSKGNQIIRLDQEKNKPINSESGIYHLPVLEKSTCLKLIQEVLNIKKYYPGAPLNSGEFSLNLIIVMII